MHKCIWWDTTQATRDYQPHGKNELSTMPPKQYYNYEAKVSSKPSMHPIYYMLGWNTSLLFDIAQFEEHKHP